MNLNTYVFLLLQINITLFRIQTIKAKYNTFTLQAKLHTDTSFFSAKNAKLQRIVQYFSLKTRMIITYDRVELLPPSRRDLVCEQTKDTQITIDR